ncbi:calcium/sodium antiporter [Desulfohalovibrio reitneri]|uniref:calcium/sodium antiporter n=1 Tax=Desulfohalovibrio reitneri TaxID=1307759 RepID=UPI0004A74FB5|nr:calcium/sodium antiporter [Desulfohalovibrio reitneri]
MFLPLVAVLAGLVILVFSADRFVAGASATAGHAGMSPLLIGMVVVGFGTSAPELVVSALAASQGNPGLALGNGFGSNIANIGLILGLTALARPLTMHSSVLRKELPILLGVTALALILLGYNNALTRADATALLLVFAGLMAWTILAGLRSRGDSLRDDVEAENLTRMPLNRAVFWLVAGLLLLIGGSRVLVWGAVEAARYLGVGELIIGLTIVAVGTSLPELASSLAAARKGESDLVLGNVLGSNLFNTLAVVGLAGGIEPLGLSPEFLARDGSAVMLFTAALFLFGWRFGGLGRITRMEGGLLLMGYIAYTLVLLGTA